ncbi:MAG: family 43 glycosylhydrolase [Bacteroidales bacterium]|nr:family 43 glycosylhydrolase [Bacteroidales bacterium]
MKNNIVNLTGLLLAIAFSSNIKADTTYTAAGNHNPLIPGYFADPTIQKFGDTYYLYATTDGIKLASGEPQVWISKDFVNWYNYEMDVPLPAGLTNCWAPDVVKGKDGKYYYFQGNCQAGCNIYGYVSDSAMGPWTRLNNGKAVIPVGTAIDGLPALDAQYMWDNDTTLYSFFGTWCTSFGGMGWARLDPDDMFTIKETGSIPTAQTPLAFEAAYPLKKNDRYILMYSSGDCRLSTYAVRYAYAYTPTGPYKEGLNNPLMATNEDGTIDSPGHHSVLQKGDDYYIVYHRHDNPHSTGGEFRQVCADSLIFDNDSTLRKINASHQGIGYLGTNQVPYPNLAYQAGTSASSYYHLVAAATRFAAASDYEYLPRYAVDDNNGTMWKAGNGMLPQSLTIDLGEIKAVKRIMTQFEYPTFYYQYKIEYSSDSTTWLLYSDKTTNRRSGCPMIDDYNADARYIRITVTGTEKSGMYAAIWNIKVYEELFEVPANQNKEVADGPGMVITNRLLVDLNIDTTTFNTVVDSLPNAGALGGMFLKTRTPTIGWIDSVKAVYFDGKSALRLSETAPLSLDWNSAYTAAAWVYNPLVGSGECLVVWTSRDDMLQSSYAALMYGKGSFGAVAHGDGYVDLPYKTLPERAKWHHIAVTFDGMLENVYVDGELNTQLPISLFVTSSTIRIAASGASGEYYSGYIANMQLYDSAFTSQGVVDLMNATRPTKVDPPVSGLNPASSSNPFNVYYDSAKKKVVITGDGDHAGLKSAKVISLDGKVLLTGKFNNTSYAEMTLKEKGAYVVVMETQHDVFSKKVVVY